MRILALDTATENCSAALLIDQELIGRELELGRGHAEHILTLIDELLAQGGTRLGALDAIAFGRGPGGFTGVRLAASVTQGLAFGAGLPVVPVSDLLAVAQRALEECGEGAAARVIVCNDARMREVYWGCFERPAGAHLATPAGEERVGKPQTVSLPPSWGTERPLLAAGRGFAVYPSLRSDLSSGRELQAVYDRLLPRAHEIARLALPVLQAGAAVDAEHAVPVYLRDDVAQPAQR
jgi:tRNA threonylcarbamoyladenosine biosynthesis protein TsaB